MKFPQKFQKEQVVTTSQRDVYAMLLNNPNTVFTESKSGIQASVNEKGKRCIFTFVINGKSSTALPSTRCNTTATWTYNKEVPLTPKELLAEINPKIGEYCAVTDDQSDVLQYLSGETVPKVLYKLLSIDPQRSYAYGVVDYNYNYVVPLRAFGTYKEGGKQCVF